LDRFKELESELNEFKNIRAAEFELSKLDKWMINRLGVVRKETGGAPEKRKGKGAIRFYWHPAKERVRGDGRFVIHVLHKKREVVVTNNFRKFAYHILMEIIACMKLEAERER